MFHWLIEMDESSTGSFDAAVDRYDNDEHANRVLAHMRARVWAQMDRAFDRSSRLLELGSGTGTEAARLASEKRCQIALVDVAPQLLNRATAKVRSANPEGVLGAHQLAARQINDLVEVYGRNFFDGAYSTFGPLNCEPDLHPVADGLAQLLRSKAPLIVSIINRFCPPEVGWYLLHGDWTNATRRFRSGVQAAAFAGGPKDIATWYYSHRDITRAFSGSFVLESVEALPLLWPPPYLDFVVGRFPRTFQMLERLETRTSRLPVLRGWGDHVLMRLRRR